LFLGDVGRPDLAQKAADMTMEDLAGLSFDSLRNKIMPLADDVTVYPGHGAGSACGKNMMKETVDTLGNQKKMNYALRADMTKEEFIKELTEDLLPPPKYFPLNVKLNKEGYTHIDEVIKKGSKGLSPEDFEAVANKSEALILDVRHQSEFIKGHIPRSIFIGLKGGFAPWVGALIADIKEYDTIESVSAKDFKSRLEKDNVPVFDVRKEGEFIAGHIENVNHTPLSLINKYLNKFPDNKPFYLHCAGGYRSVIAASILKSRGIHNLVDISGGMSAIKKVGIPISDFVCPTTISSK